MHRGHIITSQKERKLLQKEQVPQTPTQNQQKEHHMFPRSQEVQLLPRAKLCKRIPCPAPAPVLVKTYLPVSCNRQIVLMLFFYVDDAIYLSLLFVINHITVILV